jgi:hypothetical protein
MVASKALFYISFFILYIHLCHDSDLITATTMNNLGVLLKQRAFAAAQAEHKLLKIKDIQELNRRRENWELQKKQRERKVFDAYAGAFDPSYNSNSSADGSINAERSSVDVVVVLRGAAIQEAEMLYEHAVRIRADALGPSHPDTVTAMYNHVELLLAVGEDEAAHHIQQQIVALLGGDENENDIS